MPGRWSPPSGGLDLPTGVGGSQPEAGQPRQVDRGGQQLEVLGHAHQSSHAGTATPVAAAQQVRQLALDLGPGGPIVGQPDGITLAGTGGGHGGRVGGGGAPPGPPRLLVRAGRSGQTLHATPNPARPPPRRAGRMATVTRAGQVTVPAARSMQNRSLVKRPPVAVGTWVFTIGVNPCWFSQARLTPVP